MILSLTCFGSIGILVKFADLKGCRPSADYSLAYGRCVLFGIGLVIWFRGGAFRVPPGGHEIGVALGAVHAIRGIICFAGGRVRQDWTSWLSIDLSPAIPAVAGVAF